MAIKLRIDQELAKRKMSLQELAGRIGMSTVNLSGYKTGKIKAIRFNTLNALCETLRCQPGDLIIYVPDGQEEDAAIQPYGGQQVPVSGPPVLDFDIAHAVKQLREETGMTQSEFAKECGLRKTAIAHLENGDTNIPIQTLAQISERLGKHMELRLGVRFV